MVLSLRCFDQQSYSDMKWLLMYKPFIEKCLRRNAMKMCRITFSVHLFLLCMSGTIVCAEHIEVEPSVEPLIQGMDDSLQRIIGLHGKATVEFSLPVLKNSKVNAGKFAGKQLTKREEIEWFSINEKYRFSQQIQTLIDGKLVQEPIAYAGPQIMPRENWECCDNGEGTLEYQPNHEQARIKPSNRSMMNTDKIKMLVDPSYYGLKILGRTLKELSLGKDLPKNESSDQFKEIRKTFKLIGQEKHEGSICQIVQYSKQWHFNKNNYKYVYNIWVDVEHNFTIPKVFGFLSKNDKEFPTLEVNSTMQETTGGFWMPRESFVTRTIYPKSEDNPLKQRTHIKFANISVNSGLSEMDLRISIPPGTTVIDEILGTVYRISNAPAEAFGNNLVQEISDQDSLSIRPPSLVGRPLPELKDLKINISPADVSDKMLLVCFWDMEQRPSRNCIMRLAKQAQQLKQKGVTVVVVQASKIDGNALNQWVKKYKIPFPVGMVQGDEEKARFAWGVKSLPWLILTDKQHTVQAQGFSINELNERIATLKEK